MPRSIWAALGVAVGLAGCLTRPPVAAEIDRFATAVSDYPLADQTRRSLLETYRAHVRDVPAWDAEVLLAELYKTGLDGVGLADGFALAAEAQTGTATAEGTARIVLAASLQAPSAPQLLHVLRARRAAAQAKVAERVAVEGVARLHQLRFGVEDFIGYLEGLPLAASTENPWAGYEVYTYMQKLPLLADTRVAIQQAGIAAVSRHVDLQTFGVFMQALVKARLPQQEVLAYLGYVARAGSEHVTLAGLETGYNVVEELPLSAERRLQLFEGVVAALAREAAPADVVDVVRRLARAGLSAETLDGMATQALRALASLPSDAVAEAVAEALAEPAEDHVLAERLAAELSRAATVGHRRPALR